MIHRSNSNGNINDDSNENIQYDDPTNANKINGNDGYGNGYPLMGQNGYPQQAPPQQYPQQQYIPYQQIPPQPYPPQPVYDNRMINGRPLVYVRQQQGHSLAGWLLATIFTGGITLPWVIYYTFSPNHYWRF